jgi:vacuolar-type H+-ATPase subunit E/Vma4
MTFEEMDLILQKIVVSQRESQEEFRQFKEEVRMIVQSNDRTIQAILDQTATDRLKRDEERIEHELRIQLLEANNQILANTQQGVAALLGSIDEDRPTVLRKLNSIEQKTDSILDRLSPN